jgi:hypothetical protein
MATVSAAVASTTRSIAAATVATTTTATIRSASTAESTTTSPRAAASASCHARQVGSFGYDLFSSASSLALCLVMPAYLEIPVAELTIVEDKGLTDQTRFCELYIRIPAYAH